ncbi:MAG: AraC family transcriptional regulator [Rhizomicrobium sp.]
MSAPAALETRATDVMAPRPPWGTEGTVSKQLVVELLNAGLEALHTNPAVAKGYFSRARSAMLDGLELPGVDGNARYSTAGGLVAWRAKRVEAYIEANLAKHISVRELAAVVRLGPRHFQRAFRTSFGVGPHAYLMSRRIKRAQEIMLQMDAPLSQIALAVGFSDQAHLTTRFRRQVGVTPALWRRERSVCFDAAGRGNPYAGSANRPKALQAAEGLSAH